MSSVFFVWIRPILLCALHVEETASFHGICTNRYLFQALLASLCLQAIFFAAIGRFRLKRLYCIEFTFDRNSQWIDFGIIGEFCIKWMHLYYDIHFATNLKFLPAMPNNWGVAPVFSIFWSHSASSRIVLVEFMSSLKSCKRITHKIIIVLRPQTSGTPKTASFFLFK